MCLAIGYELTSAIPEGFQVCSIWLMCMNCVRKMCRWIGRQFWSRMWRISFQVFTHFNWSVDCWSWIWEFFFGKLLTILFLSNISLVDPIFGPLTTRSPLPFTPVCLGNLWHISEHSLLCEHNRVSIVSYEANIKTGTFLLIDSIFIVISLLFHLSILNSFNSSLRYYVKRVRNIEKNQKLYPQSFSIIYIPISPIKISINASEISIEK
jgi:hypothetical protein